MVSDAGADATDADIRAAVVGRTVASSFLETVRAHSAAVALRWKTPEGTWDQLTYGRYGELVSRAVSGLRELGVGPGSRVLLMMRNIPEFHVLDVAANFCGATSISVYNSSSVDQVGYLTSHSEAYLAIAQDAEFLGRFLAARSQLPDLRVLAVVDDGSDGIPDDVVRYQSIIDAPGADLDVAADDCRPDQLATMIYTSGTTGLPKAVMLDQANVTWTVESAKRIMSMDAYVGKKMISYLPMAHIAERLVSHYTALSVGMEVTTCPDPRAIADYAREVKPNFMFGVPRVWEKIYNGVNAALMADPDKKRQFDAAVDAAEPIVQKMAWDTASEDERATWDFLDEVAFAGVRELIGLDECELAISSAAPIAADVLRWFRAIGVPMSEVYGLSETTGPMTWSAYRIKPGSVGEPIPGCEVTLAEDGEVLCRGGNVFKGYYKDDERTAEVFDERGWFHSGDIGEVDEDGYFTIVDRKKELIITAGGKNVSPSNLESALKMVPLVGQAAAIGDRRPFMSALVTLDPDTAPAWARAQGIEFDSLEDLARDPRVVEAVESGVADVMASFNSAERVKKVRILSDEWMPDSDLLTPTMKLKRRGIAARYADEIEALYTS